MQTSKHQNSIYVANINSKIRNSILTNQIRKINPMENNSKMFIKVKVKVKSLSHV